MIHREYATSIEHLHPGTLLHLHPRWTEPGCAIVVARPPEHPDCADVLFGSHLVRLTIIEVYGIPRWKLVSIDGGSLEIYDVTVYHLTDFLQGALNPRRA